MSAASISMNLKWNKGFKIYNSVITGLTYKSWQWGWLRTKFYYKIYFNILIVNFPFLCSNIKAANSYTVYMEYTSPSWFNIQEFVLHIIIFLIEGNCFKVAIAWLCWSHILQNLTDAMMLILYHSLSSFALGQKKNICLFMVIWPTLLLSTLPKSFFPS